ncbi:VOC family protein [Nocardia sp. SYP-A9097]|uniref:VOC family protein n=1 Tax=Nocardia sp. SYP-A9097 TaxID=2663237 RepID=UPI001E361F83|nr:VOC family protein [Nocardia sp. SYP-A9097]
MSPAPRIGSIWGTPDIESAAAFYAGLFGWDFLPGGPEIGGYGMFRSNGRTVAGGMNIPVEQSPTAFTIYFQTADADATAAAVRAGGGEILAEPADVMDLGRTAYFRDATGVPFAVWQPGVDKGLEMVADPGSLSWIELYTPDVQGARDFYRVVFEQDFFIVPMPGGGEYTTVNPKDTGTEAMFGGIVPLDMDPVESAEGSCWLPYFEVEDVDTVVAKAEQLGGKVRSAPIDLEGVGRFAKLADPFGARFAVIRTSSS